MEFTLNIILIDFLKLVIRNNCEFNNDELRFLNKGVCISFNSILIICGLP